MDGTEEKVNLRLTRRPWFIAAMLLPATLVLAVVLWRQFGPGLPQITPDDLAQARARWQANPVSDYDLTVVLNGRQTGELKVEVRNGEPVSMTRDGTPMKQERTWRPWTVPGMFETIETDFENAARPAEKFGSADVQVVIRAKFDESHGFPVRYLHQIYGRLDDLTWRVTEFAPRERSAGLVAPKSGE